MKKNIDIHKQNEIQEMKYVKTSKE